jgi:hypothetical protein
LQAGPGTAHVDASRKSRRERLEGLKYFKMDLRAEDGESERVMDMHGLRLLSQILKYWRQQHTAWEK